MKLIFLLSCLSFVFGAPTNDADVQILRFENNIDGTGHYDFAFETSDGTKRKEASEIVNAGTDDEKIIVRGEFQYIGPDGITYTVTYIADENGFQPQGDHLPVVPDQHLKLVPNVEEVLEIFAIPQMPPSHFPAAVVASLLG